MSSTVSKNRLLSALRHPSKIMRKAHDYVNRFTSLGLEEELLDAYKLRDSPAHLKIMRMAQCYYGPSDDSKSAIQKALNYKHKLSYAKNRLYQKKIQFDLGTNVLGFNDLKIYCSSDSVLESTVYLDGFYDELTVFQVYQSHLSAGNLVVDVGANVGVHSLALASLVGSSGKVFAYEPSQKIIGRLRENLQLNHIDHVTIRMTALGEQDGEIPFNDASTEFNQGMAQYDPTSSLKVPVTSLDEDLKNRDRKVTLMKVDVEGMELQVIRGAQKVLAEDQPAIVIEYNYAPWTLSDLVQAIPFSVRLYRIPNTYHETLRPVEAHSDLPGFNNLLIIPAINGGR